MKYIYICSRHVLILELVVNRREKKNRFVQSILLLAAGWEIEWSNVVFNLRFCTSMF
jgi:hypothetical protein